MNNLLKIIVGWLIVVWFTPHAGQACSTFYLDHHSQPVFGKNYDWTVEDGLVIVNKRQVSKTAAAVDQPAKWTSKYGSVTFNQYGREFTHGGINEAGLVIELMWLNETQYPAPDARTGIDNLQWIQYQLDNFSTVAEVLASDSQIRIVPNGTQLHYLGCDRTGTCASIEFLDGQMVSHAGDTLPFKVLTNNTYADSITFLKQHKGFGGTLLIRDTTDSLDRFARAAEMLKRYEPNTSGATLEYAFAILANVAQGDRTKWSIVYDIAQRRVYFRTLTNPQIRYFDLNAFDFSCKTPVKVMDINAGKAGDVTNAFGEYTFQLNQTLVGNAFKKTEFTANIPDTILDAIAQYPDTTRCTE
jgi:penicillin V acylase-like amidase (Ntn superfamily)